MSPIIEQARSHRGRRILHWTVAVAFFVLLITGLILFTPSFSTLAEGGWTRIIHRIASVLLAVVILGYAAINYNAAIAWLKDAALWTSGASRNIDTWKRKHKLLITVGIILFTVTGAIQWFLKDALPRDAFLVSVMIHDIVFFAAIVVLLFHVYHELDWWLWKKRHCASCLTPLCSRVCPSSSLYVGSDGLAKRDSACNNCRLCMDICRREYYYGKGYLTKEKGQEHTASD